MKKYIILSIISIFTCLACSEDKLSAEESVYVNTITHICKEWGTDKQTVTEYMKGYELKYESSAVLEYFLSDKNYVVIYKFDQNGLYHSVLKVRNNADVSLNSIFKSWKYLGSSLEMGSETLITSMVDIYIKSNEDLLATTYTIEYGQDEYRIIGFVSVKDL